MTYAFGSGVVSGVGRIARGLTKQTVVSATIKSGVPKSKIVNVAKDIEGYLGKDIKVLTNPSGDKIFINVDNTRKVRFDINNFHPHEGPHMDIEMKNANGNWKKIQGPIYPKDAKD